MLLFNLIDGGAVGILPEDILRIVTPDLEQEGTIIYVKPLAQHMTTPDMYHVEAALDEVAAAFANYPRGDKQLGFQSAEGGVMEPEGDEEEEEEDDDSYRVGFKKFTPN
jgi:hypothetical protein